MSPIFAVFRDAARNAAAFLLEALAGTDAPQVLPARIAVRCDRPDARREYRNKNKMMNGL